MVAIYPYLFVRILPIWQEIVHVSTVSPKMYMALFTLGARTRSPSTVRYAFLYISLPSLILKRMKIKSNRISNMVPFGNGLPLRLSTLNGLSIHKNFIPKYLANAHRFCSNFTNYILRQLFNEHAAVNDFRKSLPVSRNAAARKIGNDVISLLLHLQN